MPNNSSTLPSRGQKPSSEENKPPGKRKSHPGAYRSLHPHPTSWRNVLGTACHHCGADVSGAVQTAWEAYDHTESPAITLNVARVTLYGDCWCCVRKFKATPPPDMPTGWPFGTNLCALFIYLRFTQGIALERLPILLSDVLGLDISEDAIVNMFEAARDCFAAQMKAIRARLLSGTALQSDETGLRVDKKNWWLWVSTTRGRGRRSRAFGTRPAHRRSSSQSPPPAFLSHETDRRRGRRHGARLHDSAAARCPFSYH
jgi:transposase